MPVVANSPSARSTTTDARPKPFLPAPLSAIIVAVLLGLVPVSAQQPDPLTTRLPLNAKENGIDGWLRVIMDSRLNDGLQQKMWGVGDPMFALGADDAEAKLFTAHPPANASLQILDATGHVWATYPLERPLARIGSADFRRRTFLVTVDYSIGMGSYAGPTTFFAEIIDGKLNWLTATDVDTKKDGPIRMSET